MVWIGPIAQPLPVKLAAKAAVLRPVQDHAHHGMRPSNRVSQARISLAVVLVTSATIRSASSFRPWQSRHRPPARGQVHHDEFGRQLQLEGLQRLRRVFCMQDVARIGTGIVVQAQGNRAANPLEQRFKRLGAIEELAQRACRSDPQQIVKFGRRRSMSISTVRLPGRRARDSARLAAVEGFAAAMGRRGYPDPVANHDRPFACAMRSAQDVERGARRAVLDFVNRPFPAIWSASREVALSDSQTRDGFSIVSGMRARKCRARSE